MAIVLSMILMGSWHRKFNFIIIDCNVPLSMIVGVIIVVSTRHNKGSRKCLQLMAVRIVVRYPQSVVNAVNIFSWRLLTSSYYYARKAEVQNISNSTLLFANIGVAIIWPCRPTSRIIIAYSESICRCIILRSFNVKRLISLADLRN